MKFIPLCNLPSFDTKSGELNAVIETPKGSHNKFDYDEAHNLFRLGGVLPAGASFPFDFGFVPSTLGEDGDPLDVLVLMDAPAFAGCLVPARVIGAIEAEQTERNGESMRNDRLIAVASNSRLHHEIHSLDDLNSGLMDEIEHFFVSYNDIKGKQFQPRQRSGPERARKLIEEGQKRLRQERTAKRTKPKSASKRAKAT